VPAGFVKALQFAPAHSGKACSEFCEPVAVERALIGKGVHLRFPFTVGGTAGSDENGARLANNCKQQQTTRGGSE
jgi:hypothetical protein